MANACHEYQIAGFVKLVPRQITAAPARHNEFSQSTLKRSSNAGLMRQDVQRVEDEIERLTSQWII